MNFNKIQEKKVLRLTNLALRSYTESSEELNLDIPSE